MVLSWRSVILEWGLEAARCLHVAVVARVLVQMMALLRLLTPLPPRHLRLLLHPAYSGRRSRVLCCGYDRKRRISLL